MYFVGKLMVISAGLDGLLDKIIVARKLLDEHTVHLIRDQVYIEP